MKIKIGISACLLGDTVRYDGQHKHDRYITDTLGEFFEYIPVCPEVECGMTIPRETMRLVGDKDSPRLETGRTKIDMTEKLSSWADRRVEELKSNDLCGYIFKKGSPSCGVYGVKVYSEDKGIPYASSSGIYAKKFMDKFKQLPIEEEGRLHDPGLRENFVEKVFIFYRWKQFLASHYTKSGLVEFHTRHKYLFMSHSTKHLSELGKIVADIKELNLASSNYYDVMMQLMELRATIKKNVNVLHHIMGYFKKQITSDEKQELLDHIELYHRQCAPLIMPLTLIRHYIRKYDQPYLSEQWYIEPHPMELMLRNHV